ncbi:MAG: hypothetical protein KatS3mg124_2100 [Porticoccaceae bacterium]|nr:MAG: hypothetical protein KatS3mg124_2100 [Porticoccaceae bacterium]
MRATWCPSPLGPLRLCWDAGGRLVALEFCGRAPQAVEAAADCPAACQLGEYFAGVRTAFRLPLAPAGTPFQQRVWQALIDLPFGQTISYGKLAARLGRPGAARAVAAACAANPLPILIPCHRVVAARGLGGYSAGLERKRWLLAHEGAPFPSL